MLRDFACFSFYMLLFPFHFMQVILGAQSSKFNGGFSVKFWKDKCQMFRSNKSWYLCKNCFKSIENAFSTVNQQHHHTRCNFIPLWTSYLWPSAASLFSANRAQDNQWRRLEMPQFTCTTHVVALHAEALGSRSWKCDVDVYSDAQHLWGGQWELQD